MIFKGVTKIIGLFWYWFAVWFRAYSRSVVYNYVLENGIDLKRVYERKPKDVGHGWILRDIHAVGRNGFVARRKKPVTKLHFWLVVFLLWGWVDDDSNQDTFDKGHNQRYISGDLKNTITGRMFGDLLYQANVDSTYGNTFDLGDLRAQSPNFSFPAALIWNTRNTAYNFNYLLWGV